MTDRITQLQDLVCKQASNFCDSITYINEHSNPANFFKLRKREKSDSNDIYHHFAVQVAKVAKDIEVLISSLPDDINCRELQTKSMERLQKENDEIAEIFKATLAQGETLLFQIQGLLDTINKKVMELNEIGNK